jgi:hypothetical protein
LPARVRDHALVQAMTELAGLASPAKLQAEIRSAITGVLNKAR